MSWLSPWLFMISFVSVVLLSFYYCSLFSFSFVSHPIGCCLLLIGSAVSMISWVYLVSKFYWCLILFALVYIGGVYVLVIFVSLQDCNPIPYSGSGSWSLIPLFVTLVAGWSGGDVGSYACVGMDMSRYLCSFHEGLCYIFCCFILIFGFGVLSIVGSSCNSFLR